jgi:hypothetical protein
MNEAEAGKILKTGAKVFIWAGESTGLLENGAKTSLIVIATLDVNIVSASLSSFVNIVIIVIRHSSLSSFVIIVIRHFYPAYSL